MKSVKYEQECEEHEDPNGFNTQKSGMQSCDDRDAFKEATIKKKRLKFDIIPIKTVLEVRKSAVSNNNLKI